MWWIVGGVVLGVVGILSICPISTYLDDRNHRRRQEELNKKKQLEYAVTEVKAARERQLQADKERVRQAQAQVAKEKAELDKIEAQL